ncbi:MAG TPA: hypothetical protein VIS72_07245 [Anaerolineales bacterium]
MRYFLLSLFVLLSLVITPPIQTSNASITIIDRKGQPTMQITDGDVIQLQITFAQSVPHQKEVHFLFNDTTITLCLVPTGKKSCTTDPFLSLGWHWDINSNPRDRIIVQASDEGGELVAESDFITVKPRPVVLVHGFISNPETWALYVGANGFLASIGLQGFAVGDDQVPGKLNTGNMFDPAERTNTIAQNAEMLGQYITGVKEKTGAQMVDLVVHSMGGMISRYYIARVMEERDVAQLIMLGSPMGGSDCAVLPASLGFYLPASIEIRESYMRGVFNQQITHRRGVEFYDLAGTAIHDAFKSPCTGIPNDMVVGFDSINAIPLQSSQITDIHSNLTLSENVFTDFVKPLLTRDTVTFTAAPDPVSTSQTESPLDFTRVYTGHVDAGGSTELTIKIDSGLTVASFALFDASRSVTTIVRGASGNIIELSPEVNGFIQLDDLSSLFYLGYGFQNPKPGPWKITLQATDKTPSNGTDFAISVYFMGGAELETVSSTLIPKINEQVRLEANLSLGGQALEIIQAQAIIIDSDGSVETMEFPAGRNISTTWNPSKAGTYAVDIVVTGIAPDGSTIERTDFLAIEVQPDPTKGQITLNLVVVIGVVLLALFLILFFIFRGMQSAFRKVRS